MRCIFLLIVAVVLLWGHRAPAQDPVNLPGNPLTGVVDFHIHSGPDSFTRSVTDIEIARLARARGMAALVFKNHFTMTADRAWIAEQVTGQRCYGGVVLNRAVGGLNPEAIRRMVTFTGGRGKVVWLPTFDGEHHIRHFKATRPSVPVVRDGQPVVELKEIFSLIAKHDLVLQTGHSSPAECLILIAAARAAGVEKILVTHAMADPIGMTVAEMKQAAQLGAKLECVWLTNLVGPHSHLESMRFWKQVTTADYATAIRTVGPEHIVLASDLGQYLNPLPTDGLKAFILGLQNAGFTANEIDRMAKDNPAWLLGIETQEKSKKR